MPKFSPMQGEATGLGLASTGQVMIVCCIIYWQHGKKLSLLLLLLHLLLLLLRKAPHALFCATIDVTTSKEATSTLLWTRIYKKKKGILGIRFT
jgi:hypothetical protein